MREEGMSEDIREAFRAGERAAEAWMRERGRAQTQLGIEDMLDWVDQLRAAFGEPEVDQRPWVGDDFRL